MILDIQKSPFILHVIILVNLIVARIVISDVATDIWHQELGSIKISPLINEPKQRAINASANKTIHNNDSLHKQQLDFNQCDFGGQHLRVAVSRQPPFVDCLQNLYGDWLCNGSNIEVIRLLERRLNFHADWIVLASNNNDNNNNENNGNNNNNNNRKSSASRFTWNKNKRLNSANHLNESLKSSGIFGLVSTGRALLSANGVMKTLDRQNYKLIVSEPFDSFKLHFLLSKSVRDHDHIFVKPFNLNAWLAIFASAGLVVPIFYLINSTSLHYSIEDDKELKRVSWWACLQHWGSKLRELLWRQERINCLGSGRQHRRSSSSSESLDVEITKMVIVGSKKSNEDEPMMDNFLSGQLVNGSTRNAKKQRRRLIKRQWNFERRKAKRLGRLSRKSGFFKMAYIVWYVVASLANQGGETEDLPRASSTRILVAFWWLYLIVICAIHSGILTAILTFPKQIDFIQTLDDYLNLLPSEKMELKLSVDKHSELAHLLADPNNLHKSPMQTLQQDESVPIMYVDFQRHRQRILDNVQQGHSAFIEEKSIITQIISQEYFDSGETKCLFKASRYPLDVIPMSLIMSTKMPANCVQLINLMLRRIMITGLAQKWRRLYESMGNDCLESVVINAGDVDKIELKHVVLAFWLLVSGISLGALSLVGEIVWFFMTDDDDDDSLSREGRESESSWANSGGSSSSSTQTTSDSEDSDGSPGDFEPVQLGHRRALQGPINKTPIRSLQTTRNDLKSILRRAKRHQKKVATKAPRITLTQEEQEEQQQQQHQEDQVDIEQELRVGPLEKRRSEERRKRRLARAAQRRSRRLQKTLHFIKKVHGGRIYSDKIKSRVRRASHAIVGHFVGSKVVVADKPMAHNNSQQIIHRDHSIRSNVRQRQLQMVGEQRVE